MSQELDQMRVRREKMEELKEAGIEPFGRRFKRDHLAQDLHDKFDQYDKEELIKCNMMQIFRQDFLEGDNGDQTFEKETLERKRKLPCTGKTVPAFL